MKNTVLLAILVLISGFSSAQNKVIWQIGENDNSPNEFALAPIGFEKFIDNDFGWEDKYYLIGKSTASNDWPYVIPGTSDAWAAQVQTLAVVRLF